MTPDDEAETKKRKIAEEEASEKEKKKAKQCAETAKDDDDDDKGDDDAKRTTGEEEAVEPLPRREMVSLNVGGKGLTTTRTTLGMCSYFAKLLKHDDLGTLLAKRDDKGAIFVDRNGETFAMVLDYLRDGALPVLDCADSLRRLLTDAEYYGVDELARACEVRLAELQGEDQRPINVTVTLPPPTTKGTSSVVAKTPKDTPEQPPEAAAVARTPLSASAFNNDNF